MKETITFQLNGEKKEIQIDPTETLLWVIRNYFNLTGTKFGCGLGFCGSCTILVDNKAERSCMLTVGDIAGKNQVWVDFTCNKNIKGRRHEIVQIGIAK